MARLIEQVRARIDGTSRLGSVFDSNALQPGTDRAAQLRADASRMALLDAPHRGEDRGSFPMGNVVRVPVRPAGDGCIDADIDAGPALLVGSYRGARTTCCSASSRGTRCISRAASEAPRSTSSRRSTRPAVCCVPPLPARSPPGRSRPSTISCSAPPRTGGWALLNNGLDAGQNRRLAATHRRGEIAAQVATGLARVPAN